MDLSSAPAPGGGAALLNECDPVGCWTCANGTCSDVGQLCVDPDTSSTSLSDWLCTCGGSLAGAAVGAPAVCVLDECVVSCGTCENNACGAANQACYDPDTAADATSDWVCRCKGAGSNAARGRPAVCRVDECRAACATCANTTCSDAGQLCWDPTGGLGDWECVCVQPASGVAVGRAAACRLDECADGQPGDATCGAAGQACRDPVQDASATGNWVCSCVGELHGDAVGEVAVCLYDECHNDLCVAESIDTAVVSMAAKLALLNNAIGSVPGTSAAECSAICQTVPQCMVYEYKPHSPNSGYPVAGTCEVGEGCCFFSLKHTVQVTPTPATSEPTTAATPLCARRVCTDAEQYCFDPQPDVASLNDWICMCPTGTVVAAADVGSAGAECSYDECIVGAGRVCARFGQDCVDQNTTEESRGDWSCMCIAPEYGSAVGGVAWCSEHNECFANCTTCADTTCSDAGQTCIDPDPSARSLGDWLCQCTALPLSAVGAAAVCDASLIRSGLMGATTDGGAVLAASYGVVFLHVLALAVVHL